MNSIMTELALIHGWGTHPVIWETLLDQLPAEWVVHNLPLPGYAGSASVANQELDEVAESLVTQMPNEVVLVGWSLGALVAMQIARRWPEKLKQLILIGSTPCFVIRSDWTHGVAERVFDDFALSLSSNYPDTLRRFLALQAQGSSSAREVLRELRARLMSQQTVAGEVLQAGLTLLQKTDLRQTLPSVPLNLVHGSGDRLAPIEAAQWMVDHSTGSRLLEINGAGHAPFLSHSHDVASFIVDVANG